MQIKIRKALTSDYQFFYKLRNNPTDKKYFFNQKQINLNKHKKWFNNNLNKKNKILLIAYLNRFIPVATVRYDLNNSTGYVSIILQKKFRGKGYGAKVLKLSEKFLKKGAFIISKVKKNNQNSIRVFEKNKYFITSVKSHITLA